MPVEPNNGEILIDLSSRSGVDELIGVARSLDPTKVQQFGTRDYRSAADIGDHLMFLAATHPEWFAPYRDEAVTDLVERLPMELGTAAVLLPGLLPSSVDHLCRKLAEDVSNWRTLSLLAASGDDHGLGVLADLVRKHGDVQWLNRMGIHIGESGPAVKRFSSSRYAIVTPAEHEPSDGVVGLPVTDVASSANGDITWHYLSLRPDAIAGVPAWPHDLIHIVSPRTYWYTLHCEVQADGRYGPTTVDDEGEPFDVHLREIEADQSPATSASLHAYDADLMYRNGHVHFTPNCVGDAGGPPVGIYPNPLCPGCGVLMFHVATVSTDIREYGEGFRSVFVCETCVRAAVTGTNWN